MTVSDWLKHSAHMLSKAEIDSARLDTLVLLSDELGKDKSWVLAHPEHVLQIEQLEKLNTKITQRTQHTPLAYIRGHAEFYGRDYVVNSHVLVPRPETEDVVDAAIKNIAGTDSPLIVDVGTGSGCIAITLALSITSSKVIGIDSSDDVLAVARRNAERLNANVTFEKGDLLSPLKAYSKSPLFVVANLPYVPLHFPINQAAKHEPEIALFSGEDGLDHYRRLFLQIDDMNLRANIIITESLMSQHALLTSITNSHGYALAETAGLVQTFTKEKKTNL